MNRNIYMLQRHGWWTTGLVVIAAALVGSLGGCGTFRSESHLSLDKPISLQVDNPIQVRVETGIPYKGTYVSAEMMELIKVDSTKGDFVLAVFGEPDRRKSLGDGSEVWVWSYQPLEENTPVVTVVKGAGGTSPPATHVMTFVRVRNGIVMQKFRG